jgi:p38 MAP kinase
MATSFFNEYMIENTAWKVPEKYYDLKSIGSGGFGAVCSAIDKNINELVVIKKLTRPFESKQHAKRTNREIILLKHVSHQNVIQLLDIFYHIEAEDLKEMYKKSIL